MKKMIFLIFTIIFSVGIFNSYEFELVPVDIDEELKKVATKEYFENSIRNAISSNSIEDAQNYYDLANYLNVGLNSQIINSLESSKNKSFVDSSFEKGNNIIQGFVLGKTENEEQFISSVVSDFTVVGDIRDFSSEFTSYVNEKPYNQLILGLSAVGIGLSASQLITVGVTTPLKFTSTVLKVTAKSGKLSKEFLKVLVEKLSKTVDFKVLKKEMDLSSPETIQKSFSKVGNAFDISHIKGISKDLNAVRNNTSIYDSTRLLQYVDTEKDLQRVAQITEKYKKSTKTVMKILGKGILKATKTVVKYSSLLILEILGLLFSLIGLFFSSYLLKFIFSAKKIQ